MLPLISHNSNNKFKQQSLPSQMSDKKFQDVQRLLATINKNADQHLKQSILNMSSSIFQSFLGQGPIEDAGYWKNKILNKVQGQYDSRSVLQCQEAVTRFLGNTAISKKSEVLKMLFKLSELVANQPSNLSFESMMSNNDQKSNVKRNSQMRETQVTYGNPSNVSVPNTSVVTKSTFPVDQLKAARHRGSIEQGISESAILKQITYKLQGIKSDMIVTDSLGQSSIKPNIQVSDTVRKIAKQLSEMGWLYSKIMEGVEQTGAVAKALRLGVRQEMNQYYRWLAVMEMKIKQEDLTLRKFILWSYQPFEKLKWLAIVLEAAKPFQGCQIISIINSYRPQGSSSINQLLNRLLTQLLHPLFQFIYNWVYRGELTDADGQFFIGVNKSKNVQDARQYNQWNRKFYLQEKNIPNLLDYDSAMKIFNAGKTIYFLKNHCKIDYVLDVPFFDINTGLSDKLHESTSILSANFKSWLANVSKTSSSYLLQVMYNKFDLKKHFEAIKMFYLAGKGDFIQALIDSLKDQLSKPKHQIAEHNLQRFISDAMSQTFKLTEINSLNTNGKKIMTIEQEIIARLTAKKVQNGPQGWDVFNFQYSVQQAPLNTVFNQTCIQKYQKIFNFLWKVKRVEQTLKQLWVSSVKDYHHGARLPVLHECQIIRQQMFHFVNNLLGYLMISIESAWNIFTEEIDKARSFDEILKLQENLIAEITEITLNTAKYKQANSFLNAVFSAILSFSSVERDLIGAFSDYVQKNRQYNNRKRIIKQGQLDFDDQLEPPYFNSSGLQSKVRQTRELYRKTFQRFYDIIKKQSESRISTLCFRLDFSGFYSQAEYRI